MKSLIAVLLSVGVILGALSPAFGYRDLETGTFITRDPSGFVDGPNLYTYVRQNPWTYFDPHGLLRGNAELIEMIDEEIGIGDGHAVDRGMANANRDTAEVGAALKESGKIVGTEVAVTAAGGVVGKGALRVAEKTGLVGRAVKFFKRIFGKGGDDVAENVVQTGREISDEGTEIVERVMSEAELIDTKAKGLVRGGREGVHHVTDAANSNAKRARQRLALDTTPEVKVKLEVPKGKFSSPKKVEPANKMPGGGMERTAEGKIPAKVVEVEDLRKDK